MTAPDDKDVLIVDDDEAIRGLLAAALLRFGVTSDTAVDGADALDQIAVTQYTVVLVDMMMPRVDGVEFVTMLREHEKTSTERPVVLMMTAFPVREVPELGEKVQAVIQKPFDVFELAELVRECVDVRRHHVQRTAGMSAGVEPGRLERNAAVPPVRDET